MKLLPTLLAACLLATTAHAQGVEVASLAAPDVFSGGARDSGLGPDLWKGSSAEIARRIIPTLGTRPLRPAARGLAVRLLSTGANAPDGAGDDRLLAAARARALLALGEPAAANASVERIPNLTAEPALAETAAETALLTGADDRACRIEEGITVGRGEIYWLRLRAYCQALAGQAEAAQLTLTLAQEKARDATLGRLMMALLIGAEPGAPSYRDGLETALSRKLGLAPPSSATAPAAIDTTGLEALLQAGPPGDLYAAALGLPLDGAARDSLFAAAGKSAAAPGRLAALQAAADRGLAGETALIALAIAQDSGKAGLIPHDRAAIIRALVRAGLVQDARAFAFEGLSAP
ncbi:MAG: hypothetical protein Q7T61_20270 [Caulobacter sp.]|nr:hypothetical protein [Caulobacter sp.]